MVLQCHWITLIEMGFIMKLRNFLAIFLPTAFLAAPVAFAFKGYLWVNLQTAEADTFGKFGISEVVATPKCEVFSFIKSTYKQGSTTKTKVNQKSSKIKIPLQCGKYAGAIGVSLRFYAGDKLIDCGEHTLYDATWLTHNANIKQFSSKNSLCQWDTPWYN